MSAIELMQLRGERQVLMALMGELLSVALTIEAEGDDEQEGLATLIQRTRNALAGAGAYVEPMIVMPMDAGLYFNSPSDAGLFCVRVDWTIGVGRAELRAGDRVLARMVLR